MWSKIRLTMQIICDIMETIIAICVGIALIISTIHFLPNLAQLVVGDGSTELFLVFLGKVFNLVVGIEFMKLLCKPSTDNVIEIVIFLVARHMIIESDSAMGIFLSVLSIAVLCIVKMGAKVVKKKLESKDED